MMSDAPESRPENVALGSRSCAGSLPPSFGPSYHHMVSAGRVLVAANSKRILDHLGYESLLFSPDSASTEMGLRRSRAMKGRLTVWQAISPRAPVPKSHQPRQAKVW